MTKVAKNIVLKDVLKDDVATQEQCLERLTKLARNIVVKRICWKDIFLRMAKLAKNFVS